MNKKRIIALVVFLLALPFFGSAQQWEIDFRDHEYKSVLSQGVVNQDNSSVLVGYYGGEDILYNPMLLEVSPDGDYTEHILYDSPDILCNNITRLANGNLMLVGICQDDCKRVKVIVLNENLDVVSSRFFDADTLAESVCSFRTMLDDDGTLVACGDYTYIEYAYTYPTRVYRPVFYRFNESGDTLACRYAKPLTSEPEYNVNIFHCYQIIKDLQTDGYIIIGNGKNGGMSLLFYDSDFRFVREYRPKCFTGNALFNNSDSPTWLSEDRILVYGESTFGCQPGDTKEKLVLADISIEGLINRSEEIVKAPDTNFNVSPFKCSAMVNDTTIYGGFYMYSSSNLSRAYSGACLFNKDMELLGTRVFIDTEDPRYCIMSSVLPMSDGGCLLVGTTHGSPHNCAKVMKLYREDLNPIPCSVKEFPQEELQAIAFPNPTHGEFNIDISDIPDGIENRVSITDMHGVVRMSRIIRGNGNLLTIDVSALEAGTYVYSVFNKNKELLKGKFVKE